MAYLKKEQYDYRKKAAARRSADNEAIAVEHGMTGKQAELISELCRLRHELHTNMNKVTVSDADMRIKSRLVKLNAAIRESGLKPAECMPSCEDDYIDIDDIDELYECDEWPEPGTREWQDKYDDEYARIYGELEQLNDDIEKYLAGIDKQYGTKWCPTGELRIM